MGFNCGIVGLPNVGKSTLFNALLGASAAEAANFPFCTIEPNVGRVSVPDRRLQALAEIVSPQKVLSAQIEFVDIAGLVRGASKGEGLGNQFLANIREMDAIVMVLRCFEDDDITHVETTVDPLRDADLVELELTLADLESLERRRESLIKRARGNDADAKEALELIDALLPTLRDGQPLRSLKPNMEAEWGRISQLGLMTSKPMLYVANVAEEDAATGNALSDAVAARAALEGMGCVVMSAAIEAEIAVLESAEERAEFLSELGLEESGLNRLIRAGYDLLGLISYFTAGEKEVRAWTIREGTLAPAAAGVIHGDFEKGFIRSETISYADYVSCNGETGARAEGKLRIEGKDYKVEDGDVLHFRFNV